ncbi:MAG: hypothetical protein KJ666_02675, partial [Bacteroidetes bacterium]|nr:hypothetical protein [Bacteroidota bacterium]
MNIALIVGGSRPPASSLWVRRAGVVPIKKCYRYRNLPAMLIAMRQAGRDVSREGSIVIPHLRYAFSVLDELMKEKDETNLT